MRIVKKLNRNFTVINNEVLKLKHLSLQAKGLYCLLMSLPETWNFSVVGLATLSSNGRDSTETAIKELEFVGLVERNKFQNEMGHWDMEYIIRDETKPISEMPTPENPSSENLETYKELNNKENTNKEPIDIPVPVKRVVSKFVPPTMEELLQYLDEIRKEDPTGTIGGLIDRHLFEPFAFMGYYESNGWLVAGKPMKSWKGAVRNWIGKEKAKLDREVFEYNSSVRESLGLDG